MVFSLPLFGDATIHGSITKQIFNKGVLEAAILYPPFYNTFQCILYSIFDEKGMNFIIIIGLLLIPMSTFLLAKEITGEAIIGFLSMIIVLSSPKLIFYSARMYMEIFLSGFFVFTIFLLMRFLKTRSTKNLILLTLFVSVTASIKQQGLFILFPSILLFLSFDFISYINKAKEKTVPKQFMKKITIFLFLFMVLTAPTYLALFHSTGKIMSGNEDFEVIKLTNQIGQKISGYQEQKEDIEFNSKYGKRLQDIQNETHLIGATRAESRHIYATDMITSLDKSIKVHGLYLEDYAGGHTSKELANAINTLMFFGILLFILNTIFHNKVLNFRSKPVQKEFLIFLLIFLVNNYLLFARNNDQMRYHFFIAILFSIFTAISIYFIWQHVIGRQKLNKPLKIISISLIILLLLIPLVTLSYQDSEFNKRWDHSQIYSPSKGGVASIEEVGVWINNNSNENDLIWQISGNELEYYSGRRVKSDYRYYFLNESELEHIFDDGKIRFIVIFDSQIVPDDKWTHYGWVPKSFEDKIKNIYPMIYRSSYGDITVYNVDVSKHRS